MQSICNYIYSDLSYLIYDNLSSNTLYIQTDYIKSISKFINKASQALVSIVDSRWSNQSVWQVWLSKLNKDMCNALSACFTKQGPVRFSRTRVYLITATV